GLTTGARMGDAVELGAIEVVSARHRQRVAVLMIKGVERRLHARGLFEQELDALWRRTITGGHPGDFALLVVGEFGEALNVTAMRPTNPNGIVLPECLRHRCNLFVVGGITGGKR